MFYYTEDGQVAYFPSAWTDAGQADPFVVLSAGRAISRFEDLPCLVKLIEDLKASFPGWLEVDFRGMVANGEYTAYFSGERFTRIELASTRYGGFWCKFY